MPSGWSTIYPASPSWSSGYPCSWATFWSCRSRSWPRSSSGAGGLALAGAGVYALAKVVKHFVERGRPSGLLDDVVVRGAEPHGLGFVSGHIAVVTALAVVAWPWLPRWGRWVVAVAVAVVFLTRMYVGAHLPLDMVGGAALGLAVGVTARLLLGTHAGTERHQRRRRLPIEASAAGSSPSVTYSTGGQASRLRSWRGSRPAETTTRAGRDS